MSRAAEGFRLALSGAARRALGALGAAVRSAATTMVGTAMLSAVAAVAAGAQSHSMIDITGVTPASAGQSAAVTVDFYSQWAQEEVCEGEGGGWGEAYCYTYAPYEYYASPGTFAATLDGASRTSAFSVAQVESWVCTYYGMGFNSYECYDRYVASASAMATTSGTTHALVASVTMSNYGTATASQSFTTPGPGRAPLISLEPHNGANRSVGACALNCFEGVLSYTTPSYTSLDTERSVTLVYNSRRVGPQRLVQVDATHPSSGGTAPVKMSLKLQRANGSWVTWFHTGGTELFYQSGSGATRLAGWFDDMPNDRPTATLYTAWVTSYFGDGTTATNSIPVRVLSGYSHYAGWYGQGWAIANVDQLYIETDQGLVLASGDGSLAYFAPCVGGCATYVSPPGDATTLVRVGHNTSHYYERRFPDESVGEYDTQGRLRRTRDRFGNGTTYNYDGTSTRLTSIVDPANKGTYFVYNASTGYLDYIQDPGMRVTDVAIDAGTGRLTSIRRPDNVYALQITNYVGNHLPAAWFDEHGGQWGWSWDGYARPNQLIAPAVVVGGASQLPTTNYLSYENAIFASLSGGKGSSGAPGDRLVPGATNLRAIIASPKGHHTYLTLDRWGAATVLDEGYGRITRATRDTLGRLLRTESPAGHVVHYSYDPAAATRYNVTQVYDSTRGATQTYQYVAGTSYPSHSSGGLEDSVWYEWEPTGVKRLKRVRRGVSSDPGTRYTYDAKGRVTLVQDGRDHEQRLHYALSGYQNTDSIKNGRSKTAFGYDQHGRTTSVTNATGGTTTMTYDVLNRVSQVSAPAQGTTTYRYGASADTVQDAKGAVYQIHRNALGWVTHEIDPFGRTTWAQHDLHGNVTWMKDRRNREVTFTYDGLDQLTGRTADAQFTGYATDAQGRWTATWNAESRDTIHFDALGRDTLEVSIRNGTDRHQIRKFHTVQGQKDTVWYTRSNGWGHLSAHYFDGRGRLTSVRDIMGAMTHLAYDADGVLTSIRMPYHGTGDSARFAIAGSHRPAEVQFSTSIPSLAALNRTYEYDPLSRVAARLDAGRTSGRMFTYDGAGRLTRQQDFDRVGTCTPVYQSIQPAEDEEPVGYDCTQAPDTAGLPGHQYYYDAVGNPLNNMNGTQVAGNRLDAYNGYQLTYYDDGSLRYRRHQSCVAPSCYEDAFTFNSLGQLSHIWTHHGGSVWYGYDGWGRRVRKQHEVGGTVQRFVYDGDNIVTEYDDAGNLPVYYTYYPGVDRPHSMWRNYAAYYYQQDNEGNVVALTDASGTVVNQYDYYPFGWHQSNPVESVPNRYRFKGREFDSETGLYHMRARSYDPRLGRFISEDPIGLAGGINPYAFAGNDPVSNSDPYGLECVKGSWQKQIISEDHIRYTWKCDVHQLETVNIRADPWKISTPRESGATSNFGNPDARGGSPLVPTLGDALNTPTLFCTTGACLGGRSGSLIPPVMPRPQSLSDLARIFDYFAEDACVRDQVSRPTTWIAAAVPSAWVGVRAGGVAGLAVWAGEVVIGAKMLCNAQRMGLR